MENVKFFDYRLDNVHLIEIHTVENAFLRSIEVAGAECVPRLDHVTIACMRFGLDGL